MHDTVSWLTRTQAQFPGKLRLLDQTKLPVEQTYLETDDLATIVDAIRRLVVRGAPAIGCAAALGLAAVAQHSRDADAPQFVEHVNTAADAMRSSRPTAVNLAWALDRCVRIVEQTAQCTPPPSVEILKQRLLDEATAILAEDKLLCRNIGNSGLTLFEGRANLGILTHCNAGALATGGIGTALAPVYAAHEQGLAPLVFADETRPLLQGARLTAWELMQAGVDVTLICDNTAAQVMREGRIDLAIVGADRIAANGDAANKIGTYGIAVLAHHHGIPFYVAAPYSTVDLKLESGSHIPIEQRDGSEVTHGFGRQTAPHHCTVYSPAFDVTPHDLISGFVTEHGVLRPPYPEALAALVREAGAKAPTS